ncbi:MAG: phosphonate C-P lyase system protein PhnK [Alphaproteobacteria bacterium]
MDAELPSPLLTARGVGRRFGPVVACRDVDLDVWPGEVVGIVGESGSGKTTLLRCLAGELAPTSGTVAYLPAGGTPVDIHALPEAERRRLAREAWGIVRQNPRDGLRLGISAGGNIAERPMMTGARHYGRVRAEAAQWMARVELDLARIDDRPSTFSGGMQQRLQIARNLVGGPRLLFMDEPTGGLDVSVQARLLDLLRRLVRELDLAAVVVTHDLGVVRLLADRVMVMHRGAVVESGLADQVLDDPHHAHTQLLVSSVLQV